MSSISKIEKTGYVLIILIILSGIGISLIDPDMFVRYYTEEDGIIENLTAVFLFGSGILMLGKIVKLTSKKNTWFLITTLFISLVFLFVGGEEISWGQRMLNVESSEFFKQNNAQAETNLHNLVIGGVKINKLIFGKLLTAGLLIYTLIFPYFYKKTDRFKKLMDKFFIPIPKFHQSLVFIICTLLILLITADRKWEVLEFCFSVIFFLILLSPVNNFIYKTGSSNP
jgi:hypothetical protein